MARNKPTWEDLFPGQIEEVKARFEDLKAQGYVSGTFRSPNLTSLGRLALGVGTAPLVRKA